MKRFKAWVHSLLHRRNRWLLYSPPGSPTGWDLSHDLRLLIPRQNPMVFDVGANTGQSIELFAEALENPIIHAFEPTPSSFDELSSKSWDATVHLHPRALGDMNGKMMLHEYELSVLNSMLRLDPQMERLTDIVPKKETEVIVTTLDSVANEFRITEIDLLKTDTQGFDLHVLRGAERLFQAGGIRSVMIELNHGAVYQGQDQMIDILQFLDARGFMLVDLYDKVRSGPQIEWSTALFIRSKPADPGQVG